jgi:outer membrane murein-binding lipoprotein Lpp
MRRKEMKRVLVLFVMVAVAFTMITGCACTQDAKKCQELCQAALDKAAQIEQSCSASARAAEASAQRAEAAARRAEAAADKCEQAFKRGLKK